MNCDWPTYWTPWISFHQFMEIILSMHWSSPPVSGNPRVDPFQVNG
jgi:hypothetical protein